jgi:inner membrane protein
MDSLTHITLGACLGEIMLGRQLGKKALLLGAVAQSLPDVDSLAALWLPVTDNLLAHRGITHSLPVGAVVAAGLAVVGQRWQTKIPWWQWFLFWFIQIGIHDLLDVTNAYGTGILEPFSHHRFSEHLLYVADPLFTLSLVVATVALLWLGHQHPARRKTAVVAVLVSVGYLGYAASNKASADEAIRRSLAARSITYSRYFSTPTPLNTWLWYAVAATDNGYYVGYRSVFEAPNELTSFTYFPRQDSLLKATDDPAAVRALQKFANGFYTVDRRGGSGEDDTLRFNVLRFGQILGWQDPRAPFTFQYYLGQNVDNFLVMQRGRFTGWNRSTVDGLLNRIWHPERSIPAGKSGHQVRNILYSKGETSRQTESSPR